jgi:UDP-glucose 4-epimerase
MILVTGGAGFIGAYTVVDLVAKGHEVTVIDDLRHRSPTPLPASVDVIEVDICSPGAAEIIREFRPSSILHLAAQGGVLRSWRDPVGDANQNVAGTINILDAAVDAACKRVVFASSGGAIYGATEVLPTPEDTTPAPRSPYGAAKLAAEGYLRLFERRRGLSTIALRFGNVYGPSQDGTGEAGLVANCCRRLLDGRPALIRGDGHQTRDFVFVDDVVEACVAALTSDFVGVVNIGTGHESTVLEVVSELTALAGGSEPIFEHGMADEVERSCLGIERARSQLGWAAKTILHDGLARTWASFAADQPLEPSGEPL